MSEQVDPNTIFETAQQGIAENYWGRDPRGADMWEYTFTETEVTQANELLQDHDLDTADQITVHRTSELSSMEDTGLFTPGRDAVWFHLKSGDILTLISLSKLEPIHEAVEPVSDVVIIEKHIQIDKDYSDITNILNAIVTGKNLLEGVEEHAAQIKEVSTPEMLAISALTKMLPGNRDSA